MHSIKNRLLRLERIQPPPAKEYRFDLIIVVDDDVSEESFQSRIKNEPHKRFVRFSDFVDECV